MKKIPSLFKRDYDNTKLVFDEVVPGSEWVLNGEGTPTRKYDGTSCMVKEGKLYKRYDMRTKSTAPPDGFIPAQEPDPKTGHWPGWLLVTESPSDLWHREAFTGDEPNGTYELCGPKIQGNHEGFAKHVLIPHGKEILKDVPLSFEGIKQYLYPLSIEGIVWHHPDGRMVKIKRTDFFR